jgi:hypothetical protein
LAGETEVSRLEAGMDFRHPTFRREVFLRFYQFHLRHRSHPGGVYLLMPYLQEHEGWGPEESLWFAFLNGNTQNPVTSWLMHRQFPLPWTPGLADWAPDPNEFGAGDVRGREARTTTNPNGHLPVYGTDLPNQLCVLVIIGADGRTCRIAGCLYAREAIVYPAPRDRLPPGAKEQYWVPQSALRPFPPGE